MNYPVNRTDFLVSKNVKNPLSVFLWDIDRKPVLVGGDVLTLRVVDRRTRRVLLTKELVLADPKKARYDVLVLPEDVRTIDVGVYEYVVARKSMDGSEALIFTDRDRKEVAAFEVREGPLPPPVEPDTIEAGDMLARTNLLDPTIIEHYSGSFPGSASVGNATAIQSYALYLNRFTGSVTIQGSLDVSPTSDDSQWFDFETHTFEGCSCIAGFTLVAHPLWVRFKVSEPVAVNPRPVDRDCATPPACADYNTITWPHDAPLGVVRIVYRS